MSKNKITTDVREAVLAGRLHKLFGDNTADLCDLYARDLSAAFVGKIVQRRQVQTLRRISKHIREARPFVDVQV